MDMCAQRLSAPGVGKEVGCTLGNTRSLFMGLFFAPTVVASAVKTATFAASLYELLGYEVTHPATKSVQTSFRRSACKSGGADCLL